MAKPKTIKWTDKQKKIAELLDQGKTRKEIVQAGFPKSTVDRVIPEWKAKKAKEEIEKKGAGGGGGGGGGGDGGKPNTVIKPNVYSLVQVGGLFIEPADWRINQYGIFLIMNTYEQARQAFGYEGSIGEFLCDCIQVTRMLMGVDLMAFDYCLLKEGDNGRREEGTSQGAGLHQEHGIGSEPAGEPGSTEIS